MSERRDPQQTDRRTEPRSPTPGRRQTDPTQAWVSIKDYAIIHGVHRNTVTKWLAGGLLVWWRTHQTVRIKNDPPKDSKETR